MVSLWKLLIAVLLCALVGDARAGFRGGSDASPKKITILHSTDLHGWVKGHPHNKTLSADYGDFFSLASHMKQMAKNNNEEFFLFDTGDLVEGSGLSDVTTVHGKEILPLVQQLPYDALTTGNHDIGRTDVTTNFKETFIPALGDAYISANVLWGSDELFANARHRIIQTVLGTRVLVLGFLFDFDHQAKNTGVIKVEKVLQSDPIVKALATDGIDLVVSIAHIAPDAPEMKAIHATVRKSRPETPFVMLCGHEHLKKFLTYDDYSFAIMSGKYFEVVGHLQFTLPTETVSKPFADLTHEWVDTSLERFYRLTKTDASSFDTPTGNEIKKTMAASYEAHGLGRVLGCNKRTLDPDVGLDNKLSLYRMYIEDVIPYFVEQSERPTSNPVFFITNTGFLRYRLFSGKVNVDDIFTIIPFSDLFHVAYNVDGSFVQALLQQMEQLPWKVALRGGQSQPAAPELPRFFATGKTPTVGVKYDIVLPEYDAMQLAQAAEILGRASELDVVAYPTDWNTTNALENYVTNEMPCQ